MKRLHGANRVEQFKEVGELLKRKIGSCEGVSGIVFMGGLVRGFVDKYSDVDVIVLLKERNESLRERIRKIGSDEQGRSGVDVDLEVHFLEDFRARKWNEVARWDFSHVRIVFDPEGEVQELFKTKLSVPNSFWLKRVVVCGEYVGWYCCSPKGNNDQTLAEIWVDRGDLLSAHCCLNYALTLFNRIIFALNREFLPPPKWEMFYSYSLNWLPPSYERLVGEALTVRSLSKPDLNRRLKATRELWVEILRKIREETGLTPGLISKEYVKHVLKQR
jgi:predicted nucleotidyltransferase